MIKPTRAESRLPRVSRSRLLPLYGRWRWIPVAIATGLTGVCSFRAVAQPADESQDDADESPEYVITESAAVRIGIDRLKKEGREFHRTGRLELLEPDFADRYEYPVNREKIPRLILRNLDVVDGVADGYMRWQLLSFDPKFEKIDMGDFRRFVKTLPELIEHPADSEKLQAEFEYLADLAGGNELVRTKLEEKWEALQIQVRQHDVLTFPSIEFRDAMYDLLPETGPYRPVFLIHDLRDRIRAGVSTRTIKSRITRELKERRLDDTLSPEIRWELIKEIEAMDKDDEDGKTKIIRDVTFYANAPADVHYSTLSVRPSDAAKWTAYLNRIEP